MIFFIAVMVWIGGIFVTSDPQTRIDRGCLPATFADRVIVAIVQVVHEPYALKAHELMLSLEYGCKFAVWKTFYESRDGVSNQRRAPQAIDVAPTAETKPTAAPKSTDPKASSPAEMTEVQLPRKASTEDASGSAPMPNYLESK